MKKIEQSALAMEEKKKKTPQAPSHSCCFKVTPIVTVAAAAVV
jgi:hypothetical protein